MEKSKNSKTDYEMEKARQLEQGLIDEGQEGISIMGMMKGNDNPVDKLRNKK